MAARRVARCVRPIVCTTFAPARSMPHMTAAHAIWDGTRLHIWAEKPDAVAPEGDLGRGQTLALHAALSHDDLRRAAGECWDALLISTAVESELKLRLPFQGGRYLSSQLPWPASVGGDPVELQARTVPTLAFSPADAIDVLDAGGRGMPAYLQAGSSLLFWSRPAALVVELLARQRFIPVVQRQPTGEIHGRWAVLIDHPTSERVALLVSAMPPVCRSIATERPLPPAELVESFLLIGADALVRRCLVGDDLAQAVQDRAANDSTMLLQWLRSLVASDSALAGAPADNESLWRRVGDWVGRLVETKQEAGLRTCLRLSAPTAAEPAAPWRLALFVQSVRDPAEVVAATDLPQTTAVAMPAIVQTPFDSAMEQVRRDAARASAHFPPLSDCARPDGPLECLLTTGEAHTFLRDAALVLESEGFGVWLPDWWRENPARIQIRMDVRPDGDGGPGASGSLGFDALVSYDWRVTLGAEELTLTEIAQLASEKEPLVRLRGRWTEIQKTELQRALDFVARQQPTRTTLIDALRRCYAAEESETGLPITGFEAKGWIDDLLNASDARITLEDVPAPTGFQGSLRPYQLRGLGWLSFLSRLGFGACLADDMGLGKTIQLIALLLHERESGRSPGPTLLVVPMSLVGNWNRELQRFGPSLKVMIHHGLERRSGQAFIEEAASRDVVVSTYGLIHRDFEYLSGVQWGRLALDEAQNIKNPAAKQSVAVRSINARHRVGLTGTPVENHLSELWTILDFLNPGYLGSAAEFRRRFAIPIERYRDSLRAKRLRQLVRPFVLRRVKSDPNVQIDLPPKLEMKVYCTLTREQAGLYQAIVNDMLAQIDRSEGMQRRGLILATLVKLKQVCNHPAHFLADGSALPQRSGKCERLTEMVEEVLAEDERALVFTQFREMGKLLKKALEQRFLREVLFLHGGTTQKDRDALVERFQSGVDASLFVLSLKAGGFGLNLTAANHVFHFDRWWNPAVEDQAADRAHRIGQHRQVQVHRFVCLGTLEERIDAMLEQKRSLAETVIGTGEAWITELSTDALRDLFALSRDAVAEE